MNFAKFLRTPFLQNTFGGLLLIWSNRLQVNSILWLFNQSLAFQLALKAFIKPFETPQRSVKIKIWFNFFHFAWDWDVKGYNEWKMETVSGISGKHWKWWNFILPLKLWSDILSKNSKISFNKSFVDKVFAPI